jgi:uncharacterized protein YegP (UPF0339 family)
MKTAALAISSLALFAGCADQLAGDVLDDGYYYSDEAIDSKADAARTGRFETFTGEDGQIYFHLLATNGEKVLASQGYSSLDAAEDGIASVRFNGIDPASFQLLQAKDGQWYFNLVAGNNKIVGTGELYVSQSNAQRGLETVADVVEHATYGRASTSGSRFQVFKGIDGQYYFHLRAGNGAIVLQSEGYTTKTNAKNGTASVLTNGSDIRKFKIKDAVNGAAYFTLVAANGKVIGVSQTYASRVAAQQAANTVSAILTTLAQQ